MTPFTMDLYPTYKGFLGVLDYDPSISDSLVTTTSSASASESSTPDALGNNGHPTQPELFILLDISGSMGENVVRLVRYILPDTIEKLGYDPENDRVTLITFESTAWVSKMTANEMKQNKYRLGARGGTDMAPGVRLLKNMLNEVVCARKDVLEKENERQEGWGSFGIRDEVETFVRILTVSDGEVWDKKETVQVGSELAEWVRGLQGELVVNSQVKYLYSSIFYNFHSSNSYTSC
jgi:hypothetical protein